MPTQHLSQFGQQLDQAQRGQNWKDATRAVKQAGQTGDLPQTFGKGAEVCERAFNSLPSSDQGVIESVSADTRQALYMLAASIQQNDHEPSQVNAIKGLVSNMAQESVISRH